ncbi:MAG TPA: hypothetical protein DCY88_24680 [Cyanobacteria bacterium UBA11372]|nr:hypothetical protein [Cyanobacteria bacterium UBA11372]
MSLLGKVWQVSPYILEKVKEYPDILTLLSWSEHISEPHGWLRELIEKFNDDISLIIAEGKTEFLDLVTGWHSMHWFFTGESEEYNLPFIVSEIPNRNEPLLVNAVLGGTRIKADFDLRYFTPDEVKQVAKALSIIAKEENFVERWKKLKQPPRTSRIYFWYIEDDWDENFIDFTNFVEYYKNASERGNAILISIN